MSTILQHYRALRPKGVALLVTVLVITTVVFIGSAGILHWSNNGYRTAVQKETRAQLFYCAESGLEFAKARLYDFTVANYFDLDYISNQFLIIAEQNFPDNVELVHYQLGNVVTNQVVDEGDYAGLGQLINRYFVNCRTCEKDNPDNAVELEFYIATRSISPFQFAIFYDEDLEFHPGPGMYVTGRVHSNEDILLWPSGDLYFFNKITCCGIWAGGRTEMMPYFRDSRRKGNVYITFPDTGQRINLYQYTTPREYFDSFDPLWSLSSQTNALNALHGAVRDDSFGTSPLLLPFEGAQSNTHAIIDPPKPTDTDALSKSRFANKAALVIESNNIMYLQTGPITNMQYTQRKEIGDITKNPHLQDFIIYTNTFYNERQHYHIRPYDIDFDKFMDWLNSPQCKSDVYNEFMGTNDRSGIIYINPPEIGDRTRDTTNAGVRLCNASEIPRSLTLATPVGLYTWGNFNTQINGNYNTNHSTVLISDAFTILSSDWKDEWNRTDNKNYRVRHPVTLNTAIIVGNSTSTYSRTGGGVHNLPRLLEDWSGMRYTLRGSLICLFASEKETGPHIDSGAPYYGPPRRDLVYDPKLADPNSSPPGFLGFYEYVTHEWRQFR